MDDNKTSIYYERRNDIVDIVKFKELVSRLTPIEEVNGVFLKREDLFEYGGACGTKTRSCLNFMRQAFGKGYTSFCTCGSRDSVQVEIVSTLCEWFGFICHVFIPEGEETSVIKNVSKNHYTTIHRVKAGYNNVIIKRCADFSKEADVFLIPFGMEMECSIAVNMKQVQNIPDNIKRIVVPFGGGVSFTSIFVGLQEAKRFDVELVGVMVGADVSKFVKEWMPRGKNIKKKLIRPNSSYHDHGKARIGDVSLDMVYEAKCISHLEQGDLFWIVGHRK